MTTQDDGLPEPIGKVARAALNRARAHAARIEAYWLARGYRVRTRVTRAPLAPDTPQDFCVTSDLINGLPRPGSRLPKSERNKL